MLMYVKSSWSENLMLSLRSSSERSDNSHVLCSHRACSQMQALLQRKAWLRDKSSLAFSSADDASRCMSDYSTSHRSRLRSSCFSSSIMKEWVVFLSACEIVFNSWVEILVFLILIIKSVIKLKLSWVERNQLNLILSSSWDWVNLSQSELNSKLS